MTVVSGRGILAVLGAGTAPFILLCSSQQNSSPGGRRSRVPPDGGANPPPRTARFNVIGRCAFFLDGSVTGQLGISNFMESKANAFSTSSPRLRKRSVTIRRFEQGIMSRRAGT
jgi:hypothetical protein